MYLNRNGVIASKPIYSCKLCVYVCMYLGTCMAFLLCVLFSFSAMPVDEEAETAENIADSDAELSDDYDDHAEEEEVFYNELL